MASVTTAPGVPAIIQQKIRSLRMKLTGWIIVDGIAWLLMFALIVAALDMGIDRLFKMDFSQRLIMLCLMVIGLGVVFYYRFIRPFAKLPTDDALILEVENQNQELKESLISSVQLSRTGEVEEKGMSVSLWEATIQQGIDQAKCPQPGQVGRKLVGSRHRNRWNDCNWRRGNPGRFSRHLVQSKYPAGQ